MESFGCGGSGVVCWNRSADRELAGFGIIIGGSEELDDFLLVNQGMHSICRGAWVSESKY